VRAVLRRGRRLDVLAATRAALLAGTVTVEQADAIAVLRQVLPLESLSSFLCKSRGDQDHLLVVRS